MVILFFILACVECGMSILQMSLRGPVILGVPTVLPRHPSSSSFVQCSQAGFAGKTSSVCLCFALFCLEKPRQIRFPPGSGACAIVSQVILRNAFPWDFSCVGFLTFLHPIVILLIKPTVFLKLKVIWGLWVGGGGGKWGLFGLCRENTCSQKRSCVCLIPEKFTGSKSAQAERISSLWLWGWGVSVKSWTR